LTVIVDVVDSFTGLGLKVAVVPLGNPVTLRETDPLNPKSPVGLIENVVDLPRAIDRDVGATDNEKSGGGAVTVRRRGSVWMAPPPVPTNASG